MHDQIVRATFRLGRIGGVAIGVNWTVLVILWLVTWSLASYMLPEWAPGHAEAVYWGAGFVAALGLLASILAHELSHAVVARRHGVPVEDITLWMFGGLARLGRRARDPASELRIAVVGPATSLAIGVACLMLAGLIAGLDGPKFLTAAVTWLGVVNVVLAVFNLLPGAPLDGGRVLTAILWQRSGDAQWARQRAARAGRILGQILIALGIVQFAVGAGAGGLWLALIGWFLTTSAHAEEAENEVEAVLEDVRVADVMTPDPRTVDGSSTVEEFVLHHALTARASSFPLIDSDGRLEGLVTLRRLRQLPRDEWAGTTLASAAVPLDQLALATPDELLVDVLHRSGRVDGRVLVLENDQRLVGIVTPTDVTAALEGRRRAEHSADDRDLHDEVQHDRQQVLHDRCQWTRPERGIGAGAGARSRSTPAVTFGPGPASASEGHSMQQTLGEQGDGDEAPFVDGGDHLQ